MVKIIILFGIFIVVLSCGQTTTESKVINKNLNTIEDDGITPDIKQMRQQYSLSYHKPIEFESFHNGKGDEKIKVWGKYYCLLDNGVIVPGKYNFDDTTKSFTTHNFAEDIAILSNADTILKKTITKQDFVTKLPQYLKDYAVIFEPKFEGYDSNNDVFDFSFSVSIPLTDVGQLMLLSLKRDGQITIKEAE